MRSGSLYNSLIDHFSPGACAEPFAPSLVQLERKMRMWPEKGRRLSVEQDKEISLSSESSQRSDKDFCFLTKVFYAVVGECEWLNCAFIIMYFCITGVWEEEKACCGQALCGNSTRRGKKRRASPCLLFLDCWKITHFTSLIIFFFFISALVCLEWMELGRQVLLKCWQEILQSPVERHS